MTKKQQLATPEEQVLCANNLILMSGLNMQPIDTSLPVPSEEICKENEYIFLNFVFTDELGFTSVRATFDILWHLIDLPGYQKNRSKNVVSKYGHMRLFKGSLGYRAGLRWGIIRPYANYKRRVNKLWQERINETKSGKFKPVGTELLSAIIMQPDIFTVIDKPMNMAGLCVTDKNDNPIFAPSIQFRDDEIVLDAYWSDEIGGCYSPTCRLL
ncbi:MAG: hypothetical protein PHO93_00670 [Candidatus Saccharimonadaceae bacterium]|nr:hypothetical protein [Candidatus Saccharimonadaceae bacterium]